MARLEIVLDFPVITYAKCLLLNDKREKYRKVWNQFECFWCIHYIGAGRLAEFQQVHKSNEKTNEFLFLFFILIL